MGSHKNLNDVIYGDRSYGRGEAMLFDIGTYKSGGMGKKDDHYYAGVGERCHHKHPPLKLPGTDLVIYGGSCISPVVKDADVYIGLDEGMRFTERHWPWKKGAEVKFTIPDMSTPTKPDEFRKLVRWTKTQLEAGLKVHCGCIGGHGRTGTFLAALASEFGEKDAISYVRANYCSRAVESTSQVKFLNEHFGIVKVAGAKAGTYASAGKDAGSKGSKGVEANDVFTPVKGNGCIWDKLK